LNTFLYSRRDILIALTPGGFEAPGFFRTPSFVCLSLSSTVRGNDPFVYAIRPANRPTIPNLISRPRQVVSAFIIKFCVLFPPPAFLLYMLYHARIATYARALRNAPPRIRAYLFSTCCTYLSFTCSACRRKCTIIRRQSSRAFAAFVIFVRDSHGNAFKTLNAFAR